MSGLTNRIALIAAAIGATVALSVQPQGAVAESPPRDCFNSDAVSGFSAPDDEAIYVTVGANRVYELKVLGSCPNLDWTHSIGLKSRGSSFVCTGMDVDLIVPQDGMGPPLRCAVRTVRRLTPDEAKALRSSRN
jgi:hypothetical protein